jgi:anti-anti-sigma factor
MSIVVDTTRDLDNGVTTVRLNGGLTFATAPAVRATLAKCASECPTAVIVDLAALEVASPALLGVFAAAAQRANAQWGVPLLLCSARPGIGRSISVFRTFTEVYDSPGSALEALRGWAPRWRHHRFAPVPASARLARHLVAEACQDWNLSSQSNHAMLIVSELASNAVQHAGTDFHVTVRYTTTYLRIAVQDGGSALPQWVPESAGNPVALDNGRGLHIVNAIATAWNSTSIAGGKIVWALLRTRPLDASRGLENPAFARPNQRSMAQMMGGVRSGHDGPPTTPDSSTRRQSPAGDGLSDRETEVLSYLPTMLTAGEIAADLHVSVNTVKAHLRSIYSKLDVSRRQDAVLRAYGHGLLS